MAFGLLVCAGLPSYAQNVTDDKGRKQGEWIKKDDKGRIVYKGQFKNDIPVDTFTYYNRKGAVDMKNIYSDGGKKTHTLLMYPNGRIKAEGDYFNKKKEGVWTYYTEKGIMISQENYKNNLKDGTEKKWDTQGKDLIEQTEYVKGVKNGAYFKTLYEDGYIKANYKDGELDGDYKEFYPDDVLRTQGQFKNGKREGKWNVYDMSSVLVRKLTYVNDSLTSDLLLLNVQQGVKETEQSDIAVIRQAGKQSQIILTSGDRINVFNSLGSIIPLTDNNVFYRINEKSELYININTVQGVNADGSVKTTFDCGEKIMPDKDGLKLLNSLFSRD